MFGERMRQAREALDFTQEELAERAGLEVLQIWRYESGKTKPKTDVLARIAVALHVSSDYLLELTDDPGGYREDSLSDVERLAIAAWRRGDKFVAIKTIVNEQS